MPVATYRGEKSLAELADKLFLRLSEPERKQAEAALLKANPRLKDIEKLADGAVLFVPESPRLRPKLTRELENPDHLLVDDLTKSLASFAKSFTKRADSARIELKQATQTLQSADLDKALAGDDNARKLAAQAATSIKDQSASIQEREERLQAAIQRVTTDLAK